MTIAKICVEYKTDGNFDETELLQIRNAISSEVYDMDGDAVQNSFRFEYFADATQADSIPAHPIADRFDALSEKAQKVVTDMMEILEEVEGMDS